MSLSTMEKSATHSENPKQNISTLYYTPNIINGVINHHKASRKMGTIEDDQSHILHFTHSHPLTLINSSPPNSNTCSLCNKESLGVVYNCDSCKYSLHKLCSKMLEKFVHMSDPKHALTLLTASPYPGGVFRCNACGVVGAGFCYHCGECELDLHPACAFTRSVVKGGAHDHPLYLCFKPPYADKGFVCDVCGGIGSNHWLYRCEPCGFDTHLKCGKAERVRIVQPKMDARAQSSSRSLHGGNGQMFRSTHVFHPGPSYVGQQPARNDVAQQVVNSVIEGVVEAAAGQLGQALFQGALGN